MEKEADQMLQDELELSWKELGIDISEDEEDGEVIPEENRVEMMKNLWKMGANLWKMGRKGLSPKVVMKFHWKQK